MVLKVQRVHKAIKVPQDSQVLMVPKGQRDTLAPQEHQVKAVSLDCLDQWDPLDLLVLQVPLDSRVIQVFQVHLAQLA